jgi:hypothetical protein
VDVVRAVRLDLTGRRVPDGEQRAGHRYVVENTDLPALLACRRSGYTTPHAPERPSGTGPAWLAGHDPLPFVTMLARFVRPARSTSTGCGAPTAAAPARPRSRHHVRAPASRPATAPRLPGAGYASSVPGPYVTCRPRSPRTVR